MTPSEQFQKRVKQLSEYRDECNKWGYRYILMAVAIYFGGLYLLINDNGVGWWAIGLAALVFWQGNADMAKGRKYDYQILREFDREFIRILRGLK